MKFLISSLVVLCAILSACSDDSGDKKDGGGGYAFTQDYQPNYKPQNAAPTQYLKDILVSIKDTNLYVPDDAAFFDAIINGSDVRPIWDGSQERQEALQKLSGDGLRFLNDIRTTCAINNAKKTESGEIRQGATKSQTLTMSTSGAGCPFVVSKNNLSETTYDTIDVNQAAQTFHVVMRLSGVNSETREIRNQRVVDLSGTRSMAVNLRLSGNADVTQTASQQTMKMRIQGNGTVSVVLANGDTIGGLLSMEVVGTEQASESRVLFDGQSNHGAIRIVFIVRSNQPPEIYLNGEKVNAAEWGGIGKMNLGVRGI